MYNKYCRVSYVSTVVSKKVAVLSISHQILHHDQKRFNIKLLLKYVTA